jgi:predicted enzyme related to lactoylglutathione lyase
MIHSKQVWMLNFRLRNLDAMTAQLRGAGIEVEVDPQLYPNGGFARVRDPEGNPVELMGARRVRCCPFLSIAEVL